MTEIRIIRYSSENGNREGVFFTEDMELNSKQVIPYGCSIDSDTVITASNWDTCFPMDYNLERQ